MQGPVDAALLFFFGQFEPPMLLERWLLTPPLRSSTLLMSCQDLVVDEVELSPTDDVVSASRDVAVEP